jgi:hypothetical protein
VRPRAETFADRLEPVVPKVEDDVDHLPDELVDILYPGRRPGPFQVSVVFDAADEAKDPAGAEAVARAVAIGRASAASFRTFQEGSRARHRADFTVGEARALNDLASLVAGRPGSDVLVAGRKAPYGHELWLPLMAFFIGPEPSAKE